MHDIAISILSLSVITNEMSATAVKAISAVATNIQRTE
jgi:hypothetical protein